MLEVVEDAPSPRALDFEGGLDARSDGSLIALDDFGAGASNFDCVWRLRPEIVKLDRSLVRARGPEPQARRVIAQMVTLLHHYGALVLMEGVQTEDEALVAPRRERRSGAGRVVRRPGRRPRAGRRDTTRARRSLAAHEQGARSTSVPTRSACGRMSRRSSARRPCSPGRTLADACVTFLRLPAAEVCYL